MAYDFIISPEPSGYSIPMVRRPSVHIFKDLLLQNRLANQSQILCGASLGRGNESLFAVSGSHDQDGHHAHIWYKPIKNLLRNRQVDFQTWYVASGTHAHDICSNDDPGMILTYFTARSNLATFLLEKVKTVDFSETIAACDLKVGRCRQLIEFMKVCEY